MWGLSLELLTRNKYNQIFVITKHLGYGMDITILNNFLEEKETLGFVILVKKIQVLLVVKCYKSNVFMDFEL